MRTDVRAIRYISPRRVRAQRFARLAVAVGLIAGGLAGAPPAGAAAVWSMSSSPNPAGSINTTLSGVACPTTTSCFAVGRFTAGGVTKTLIEHWNGSGWGSMPSPNPGSATTSNLSGIACPSTKSCFAVGSYSTGGGQRTLVEHWNGSAWGFLTGANPSIATDASLTGVSCPNLKGCFAVGSYSTASSTNTLVEHWNGSEWGIQASPNPPGGAANLRSIACPSPKSCFAVGATATGSGIRAFAEHWNGTGWGFLTAANPSTATAATLTGVACREHQELFRGRQLLHDRGQQDARRALERQQLVDPDQCQPVVVELERRGVPEHEELFRGRQRFGQGPHRALERERLGDHLQPEPVGRRSTDTRSRARAHGSASRSGPTRRPSSGSAWRCATGSPARVGVSTRDR